jgi:outer membrane protein insertion porin family
MKYIFSIVFGVAFLFLPSLTFAESNKISKVLVEGLQNVKKGKVLDVVELKKSKYYSPDILRSDIKAILALNFFETADASFDEQTGVLTFTISEKPYIKNIVFKGNNEIGEGKLKRESVLKEKEFYDIIKLEETKRKITDLYQDKGYQNVSVEVYPTVDTDKNEIVVTFLITENNKISISGVKINGIKSFKYRKIRKLLQTKKGDISKTDIFNLDLKKIDAFYKEHGYLDFKVIETSNSFNDDETQVFINVFMDEGIQYKIGDIGMDIKTNSGKLGVKSKDIKQAVKIKKHETYSQSKLMRTVQGIYEIYSDGGYLNAVINPEFDRKTEESGNGIVDINLQIQENQIVYLGNVYIDGLTSTKEKVIRRELLVYPGGILSALKIRRSVERIRNLGFIDSVEPQIMPTNRPDVMELAISVTEGRPGMITMGAGYSSVDEFVGSIQLQHMNLFGLAQKLNLLWEFGQKRQNYQISWTDPWIFDKDASLSLSVYNIQRWQDYGSWTDAYQEDRVGFSVKVGPRLDDKLALLFGYSFENVKLHDYDNDVVKAQIASATDLSQDNSANISAQLIYDTRDYIFDASRGNRQSVTVILADSFFGGNVDYFKTIAKSTWFFPTFWKFVLSVNFTGGIASSYGISSKVPLYEKFYIGGADTVRGYRYRTEIGPEDGSGGTIMTTLNIEYKFPLVSEKGRTVLQGAFFYDIGGVWNDWRDVSFERGTGENDLRSGVGFGIRFVTPVFPLRLDWGYGLDHKSGETLQQFYFTIGNIF